MLREPGFGTESVFPKLYQIYHFTAKGSWAVMKLGDGIPSSKPFPGAGTDQTLAITFKMRAEIETFFFQPNREQEVHQEAVSPSRVRHGVDVCLCDMQHPAGCIQSGAWWD